MKNKILMGFVGLASVALLFSCSKDDSSDPVTADPIVAKWNYNKTSYTVHGSTSPEMAYEGHEEGCNKDYIEFKSGGVYEEGDYVAECELQTYSGTWTKNGNVVTVTVGDEVRNYEVVVSSTVAMKLEYTYTVSETTFIQTTSFTKN